MKSFLTSAVCAVAFASTAHAEGSIVKSFDGSFEDAAFAVESAIVDRGLVIDYVSHVGDMLNRTGSDVGSDKQIFKSADIFIFCSAVLSREMMEADPMNIAHCPYGVFVAENDDGVVVGYREYPDGAMQKVQALLEEIASEAVE